MGSCLGKKVQKNYPCPYNSDYPCTMIEGCLGCVNWDKGLKEAKKKDPVLNHDTIRDMCDEISNVSEYLSRIRSMVGDPVITGNIFRNVKTLDVCVKSLELMIGDV